MAGWPIGPCKALSTFDHWLLRRFRVRHRRDRGCVPMILRVAKGKGIHAALKTALLFGPILKRNPDLVGTALVAVYKHHRPFAVGSMQGIGGIESVPSIIFDVA